MTPTCAETKKSKQGSVSNSGIIMAEKNIQLIGMGRNPDVFYIRTCLQSGDSYCGEVIDKVEVGSCVLWYLVEGIKVHNDVEKVGEICE